MRDRSSTGLRINPTSVRYQLDALSCYVCQMRFQHCVDKVRGKTTILIPCAGSRHDRHRDLGEVVINDIVQSSGCQQLGRGHCGFSPETAGTADSYSLVRHCYGQYCGRRWLLPLTEPDRCPISRSFSACRFLPLTRVSGIWVQSNLLIWLISRSRRSTEVDGI